jgi:SAM-dependent methyltransferase
MPDRPITKDRVVAAVRWRVRRLRRRWKARFEREVTPAQSKIAGLVEVFTKDKVSGWVAVTADAPPVRVSLLVNELEVAATWATDTLADRNNWGEVRPFDFRVRDVWAYSKTKYKFTVRVEGTSLPIAGHGMYLAPPANGGQDLTILKGKLADGFIFGQTGRLQLSKKLDTEWQARVMGLYDRVRAIVHEAYGYDVFFVYGTLLGAVREGGVIGHDLDFDSAYVSKHTDGEAAAKELQDIAYLLIERGLDVQCMRTALHVHDAVDPTSKIDLFHVYFNQDGYLQFPFGVAGTSEVMSSDWRGMKEIEFCGGRGLVPVNAEQVTEHIYGAGWRSPKPGFDWKRDRTKRDQSGILPLSYGDEVYWANFYARSEAAPPSSFAELALARADLPSTVIDIGCGDGRDSLAFASSGRTVLGLDRAENAVRRAAERADELGVADRASFTACDLTDAPALREHVSSALAKAEGPAVFYLRFLLHAISAEAQSALLRTLSEVARPGDLLMAELRTDKDEALPKAFGKHFRRFQDGPALSAALREEYGFEVVDDQQGTGLAPFRNEDPQLYRVLARRSA